ncbi:MAG TPA: fibronectin type III domain-containing protein [Thermoanaerobaculia bacterium]|jgi:hypothetical protein|nr:fibronectin type III domain-containing protein [Thermoanaerobaculia bacterium]
MFLHKRFLRKSLAWGGFALVLLIGVPAAAAGSAGAGSRVNTNASKPARPTSLHAKATSTTEAHLTWSDNATNESEYHLELRTGSDPWLDMGPIPPNATFIQVFDLKPASTYFFRLRAKNRAGWSLYSNETAATSYFQTPPACVPGDGVMCLDNGRYRVEATYERGSDVHGNAHVSALSQQSGLFWFFSSTNVEALVKVLDGCTVNNHRWVYATGLTDLRVLVRLVDTKTGETASYLNEGGGAFAPVQDTEALSCD